MIVVLVVGGYNASRDLDPERTQCRAQAGQRRARHQDRRDRHAQAGNRSAKARQQAVEDLQGDRNQPVYLFDELVRQTPQGVYLQVVQAGRPARHADRLRPVAGTGRRTAAQPGRRLGLAGAARPGRSRARCRWPGSKTGKQGRRIHAWACGIKRPRDKDAAEAGTEPPASGRSRRGADVGDGQRHRAPRSGIAENDTNMNIDLKSSASRCGPVPEPAGRQPGQWPLAPRLLCGSA